MKTGLIGIKKIVSRAMSFSSSLEMNRRLDIGLKLFITEESSPGFFKIGMTTAVFNDSGTDLEEIEQLIK